MEETIYEETNPIDTEGQQHEDLESEAFEKQEEDIEAKKREILSSIASDIQSKFDALKSRRSIKEQQWFTSESLYLGDVASNFNGTLPLKDGSNTNTRAPQFNLIGTKCDATISILWSRQFAGGDKNWDIYPPKRPDVAQSPGVDYKSMAMAAEAMEEVIEDQLDYCKYGYNMRLAMEDRVIRGTAVVKTPVNNVEPAIQYSPSSVNPGTYVPNVREKSYPCVKRINPWFFYPDDTVTDIRDASYAIVLHPKSSLQLTKMKTMPGYFKEAIDKILLSPPESDNGESYFNFSKLTDSSSNVMKDKYKVLEYHGPIAKDQLGMIGLEPGYSVPNEVYFAEIWICNGEVIRAELSNIEGAQSVPFQVCPYKKDPSSIFGIPLPILLQNSQRVVNITYEMILDNASIAAGPMVIMDKTKIVPANEDWTLRPFKIFYNTEYDADLTKAIYEFQPSNVIGPLMSIMEMAQGFGQEEGAIPFFMPGTQSGQVAPTAHGTEKILQNSSTVIDMYNETWDDMITYGVIESFYKWNMQYNPRKEIKGNFEINVKATSDEKAAEINIANLEKLAVAAGQDPGLGMYIDSRELTKARLRAMNISDKSIIKTDDQVEADEANKGPDPQMIKLQIEQQLAAVKEREVALKEQELQLKAEQDYQKAMWDHEEKMAAQYARLREAEAQVIAAQLAQQTEMLRLAQQDEQHRAKLLADIEKTQITANTQKYLKGIDATIKFKDQALSEQEIQLKKQGKTGI